MIIFNPIGGIANRLRCIVCGLELAKELKSDYRFVWARNYELDARFEDILEMPAELNGKMVYPSSLSYFLLYSVPRRKNLYITKLTGRRFGVALYWGYGLYKQIDAEYEDNAPAITGLCRKSLKEGKIPYISSGCRFQPDDTFPSIYPRLFRPADSIREEIECVRERLGSRPVGIHIRRTDNTRSIKQSPDSLFINQMKQELEMYPETIFYLATDDTATKKRFHQYFGNRVVTMPRKAERGNLQGIRDAATELFILAGTAKIYGSYYSSFSEAAALLGETPLKTLCLTKSCSAN